MIDHQQLFQYHFLIHPYLRKVFLNQQLTVFGHLLLDPYQHLLFQDRLKVIPHRVQLYLLL
ncbi:hypothetical protein C1X30_32205 [Pseudomonas sp. FW305-BF6]|nr:hypothetical protein C1X30_32205 [Pseudomonas sp. FW305-BF6]